MEASFFHVRSQEAFKLPSFSLTTVDWFLRQGLGAQAVLKLAIFLLQSPNCWNYRRVPSHLEKHGIMW